MSYRYYNANSHNRNVDDCFIRCLCVLTGKKWLDIYKEVSNLAGRQGRLFSDVDFVEDYLDDRYDRECTYSMTVGDFAYEHPYRKLRSYNEWTYYSNYKWRNYRYI